MLNIPKSLSVSQAAALCKVGRTTVGYWVRSKKVFANREGRNYRIPVEDLLHFLKSSGQPIPPELVNGHAGRPIFKTFQSCWTFWGGNGSGHVCEQCTAFRRQIEDCFRARDSGQSGCPQTCRECRYYHETFLARFQFIHQISVPAAVFRDLSIWGGNPAWAALCDLPEESLIGIGIEKIIHPQSLPAVISTLKRMSLEEKAGGATGPIFINARQRGKRAVDAWVIPLLEPEGALLLLAMPPGADAGAVAG
ncbi:MAG: helix-turn-helix domain-containing protein [Desulfobacterales bacterium]|jgi:excisionase family DNA binding protein|nr:helix-turn-helix domain-containing protein [Desulfobacterales bacterium]